MGKHQLAIATVSLGWHKSHTLERKLESAAKAGYQGVEIFHPDLVGYADAHSLTHLDAALAIGQLCKDKDLSVVSLQPLNDFAGPLTPLETRMEAARAFIDMARALGTSVIQVPTTYDPNSTGDEDIVVRELQALADLGREGPAPITFAYEALGWGIHHAYLDDAVRIVNLVDRPNFGLCLDTYHVLSRVWADPRAVTGVAPAADAALKRTLRKFREECRSEKIVFVQLSDAEKLDRPLVEGHPGHKPDWAHWDVSMHWCIWGRLFPYETEYGAYFPLDDIIRLWLKDMGWTGWVSMEMFHRDENKEEVGPDVLAARGYKSWLEVKKRAGLE